jgi:hypothetical protein
MTDRISFRPAQTGDFEFCHRLYLEGMGWIIERLQLDIKRQYKILCEPVEARRGSRNSSCR